MRDGLEKMGLAQAHRGVEIKRIEQQRVARCREGNSLRRGMGELIGCADEKIRENQAAVQRRSSEGVGPSHPSVDADFFGAGIDAANAAIAARTDH